MTCEVTYTDGTAISVGGHIVTKSEVLLELELSVSVTTEESAIVDAAIIRAEGAIARHLHYQPWQATRTEYYPMMQSNVASRRFHYDTTDTNAIRIQTEAAAISELQIRHLPLRSITTLHVDHDGRSGTQSGAFGSDTLQVEGVDFWPNYDGNDQAGNPLCRDGIIRALGSWPLQPGSVKIVYTAGYTSAEFHGTSTIIDATPILDAALNETVRRAKKALVNKKSTLGWSAGPKTSEKLGDYAYTVDASLSAKLFGDMWQLMPGSVIALSPYINMGIMIAN